MKTETTVQYRFTPLRWLESGCVVSSAGRDEERSETSYIADVTVK